MDRLRWSRGSVLAFGTQVRGFKPGRSLRIFKGGKIFSTPSFGEEVKPSVPCRRFATCRRSLELRGSRILDEICRNISRPRRVLPSTARGLSRRWTWRHLAEKVGRSKGGGKQWQPTLRICSGCSVPEGRLTGFWFLLKPAQGLNTNEWMNTRCNCVASFRSSPHYHRCSIHVKDIFLLNFKISNQRRPLLLSLWANALILVGGSLVDVQRRCLKWSHQVSIFFVIACYFAERGFVPSVGLGENAVLCDECQLVPCQRYEEQ
jgi:hypothetical protein